MALESECSVLVSVEDNEEMKNVSQLDKLGKIGESEVQNNGCYKVENNDNHELLSDVKEKGTEVLGSVRSPSAEMKPEVSPSPTTTRKGHGLKKWKRIKRDVRKGGDNRVDTGKMVMRELSNSLGNPSKRTQVYAERQQKSEGSVSSTNPVAGDLDVFALCGNPGFVMGPSVDAGTDSENSEDQSSKSSTAASVPKIKYEIPVVTGFPHDKMRIRSLSGKNLTHSVQRGHQGKGRIESMKKARGDRVKIEKENSHSSIESDSRSSNFVFMQGTYTTSNGIRSKKPVNHDGENGDEVQCRERRASNGVRAEYRRDGIVGDEDISPEDVVADSSWEGRKERSGNRGSSSDQDPLVESIFALQTAQDALEKEVLKFKEIIKDASVDGSVSDIHPDFTNVGEKLLEISSEHSHSGEDVNSSSRAVLSEVVGAPNRDLETELEHLFKQRIEAEVEYLAISRSVQKLRFAAVDQTAPSEEQTAPDSVQTQKLEKLEDTENFREDVANADETLKIQKKVYKYSSHFFVQLLLLLVILGVFIFRLSPDYVEVVPT
ncbi:hypothetical protein CDL12_02145 [Handroanthus impetiginosus]|uniref:Uncharacterized protein n=1 Tax=Handroanthus impetiginosus TaxID=429701 RepID=A0A2G9I5V6_9LAMI|nr:hypothetical protein CDL12_02145 [Handroanthus impetiginosus]